MIKESKPITIAEVLDKVGNSDKADALKKFMKGFDILDLKKAKALEKELSDLNLIKLKDEHIVKIVDFVPTNATDLSKVVVGVSFDQEEVNKILEITKKYR